MAPPDSPLAGQFHDQHSFNPTISVEGRANMIRVGVIGYGYWGPNIVRNLHGLDEVCVQMVCDNSPAALGRVRKNHPDVPTTSDPWEVLNSPEIGARKRQTCIRGEALHI
jgi:hypothetical protein